MSVPVGVLVASAAESQSAMPYNMSLALVVVRPGGDQLIVGVVRRVLVGVPSSGLETRNPAWRKNDPPMPKVPPLIVAVTVVPEVTPPGTRQNSILISLVPLSIPLTKPSLVGVLPGTVTAPVCAGSETHPRITIRSSLAGTVCVVVPV